MNQVNLEGKITSVTPVVLLAIGSVSQRMLVRPVRLIVNEAIPWAELCTPLALMYTFV